jgi:hypothetical protein
MQKKSSGDVSMQYVNYCGISPHKKQPIKALQSNEFLHPIVTGIRGIDWPG